MKCPTLPNRGGTHTPKKKEPTDKLKISDFSLFACVLVVLQKGR